MRLPNPGMTISPGRTAPVLTDLQNDFLSPGGNGWALFSESYARLGTIDNLEALLKAAKAGGLPVLISPHYYYPTDRQWTSPGSATEELMADLGVPEARAAHPRRLRGLRGRLPGPLQALHSRRRHGGHQPPQGLRIVDQ